MKRERVFKIGLLLFVIPFIIGAIVYRSMPDIMPTHFNMNNQADGFSSKNFALFGIPLFMLAVYILTYFITKEDPRKNKQSEKLISIIILFLPLLSILVSLLTIFYVRGVGLDMSKIIMIFLGLLFIVIGNYMPKVKRNYTLGIKLPWTLHSDYVWDKTHRMGAMTFVIGGIGLIIVSFLPIRFYGSLAIIIIMVLLPTGYSYYVYKNQENKI